MKEKIKSILDNLESELGSIKWQICIRMATMLIKIWKHIRRLL